MTGLALLLRLSLRNLVAHRAKTVALAVLLAGGAALLTVGFSIVESIDRAMATTISSSVAGDLHVYSSDARDSLALFGGLEFGDPNIGEIDDIAVLQRALTSVDVVEAMVPMGIRLAEVSAPTDLDRTLEALRASVNEGNTERTAELAEKVRSAAQALHRQLEEEARAGLSPEAPAGARTAAHAATLEAWSELETAPVALLDRLDVELAPLSGEGRRAVARLLGTDLPLFARAFDRLRVVEGGLIPPGRRGLMLNQAEWQKTFRIAIAKELDALADARRQGRSVVKDPLLRERAALLPEHRHSVLVQLSGPQQASMRAKLATLLGDGGSLEDLLVTFLTVDDESLLERHRFFSEELAPMLRLHVIRPGDAVIVRSITEGGYARARSLTFYGTYEFVGLEGVPMAGIAGIVDLVTLRDLYGKVTEAERAEQAALARDVDVRDVSREEAEAVFFGADAGPLTAEAAASVKPSSVPAERSARVSDTFPEAAMSSGLALSAALRLQSGAAPDASRARVEAALRSAGLELKVVSWRDAAGIYGQATLAFSMILYVAIWMIFLVAAVIVNNAMMLTLLDRVREIGTLRAVGAQRGFVRGLVLGESLLLGLVASSLGGAAGALAVVGLARVGIPAPADLFHFLFGGDTLRPSVSVSTVLSAVGMITALAGLASLYPAWFATSVSPKVAMESHA